MICCMQEMRKRESFSLVSGADAVATVYVSLSLYPVVHHDSVLPSNGRVVSQSHNSLAHKYRRTFRQAHFTHDHRHDAGDPELVYPV